MDEKQRCNWPGNNELYQHYHDTDWGVPEYDSRALFEKLILDGFQAGLAWITILTKRENFREAFDGFDPYIVAKYTEEDVLRILGNKGVVRHRGKIEAAITNAKVWIDIEENYEGGFSAYLWDYVGGSPLQMNVTTQDEVLTQSPLSAEISKNLKKRGFKFCGPTIVYAFMEAVGMINDHLVTCFRHEEVKQLVRNGA